MRPSRLRLRRARDLVAIVGLGAIAAAAPAQATTPLGVQTQISVTGADGDATLDATAASVAYNPSANQYLVAWEGDDDTGQLLLNQRISQAAVRQANDLIARIEDGLLGSDVRDGTVTALDLAPAVAAP